MGACGSKARRCIGMSDLHRKKHQGRRNSVSHKLNKIEPSASKNISCSSSLSKGNGEFDPEVMIESESSNDSHRVQDVFSQSGSGSFSTAISPRFYDTVCCNSNAAFDSAVKHEQSLANAEPNIVRDDYGFTLDEVSSRNMDRNAARAEGVRLEKRKSAIPSSPGTRRKSSLTKILSFKQREAYSNSASLSSKASLRRPVAGSQVRCSPRRTKLSNSWSSIEPNTFKVRGKGYFRDKKKEFAPNHAAFYPFGVDVFL